ncbi:hypothetical protein Tco_0030938 [Tanacetum coccineum]
MDTTRAEQIALDDALVAPVNRLKIGKSNLRLSSDLIWGDSISPDSFLSSILLLVVMVVIVVVTVILVVVVVEIIGVVIVVTIIRVVVVVIVGGVPSIHQLFICGSLDPCKKHKL